jgi:hypothetical protein
MVFLRFKKIKGNLKYSYAGRSLDCEIWKEDKP